MRYAANLIILMQNKAKTKPRSFMPETKIQDLHRIQMIYIYQKINAPDEKNKLKITKVNSINNFVEQLLTQNQFVLQYFHLQISNLKLIHLILLSKLFLNI